MRVQPSGSAFLTVVLDKLVEAHCAEVGNAAVVAARSEFERRRGSARQDEPLWEAWTSSFLEWFVVERPTTTGETAAAKHASQSPDDNTRTALLALSTSQRVLGEVVDLAPSRVEIRDLLGGASFAVTERRSLHGVRKGDVCEVRVIGYDNQVYFGRLFVHHPAGTRFVIERHIRELRSRGHSDLEICDALAARRLRCDRYAHVTPQRVYEETPKIEPAVPRVEDVSRNRDAYNV
jgi:hypothetical protein